MSIISKFLQERVLYIVITGFVLLLGVVFILFGYLQYRDLSFEVILYSIGTSLIATSLVLFLDLGRKFAKDKLLNKITNIIYEGGVEYVYRKRDLDEYDKLMQNLSGELNIAGYSLIGFFDSFGDLLDEKLAANSDLLVRMLIINPDSDFSHHRAELEGKNPSTYKDNILRINSKLGHHSNFHLRLLSSPLSTMIFKIDEILFIGPHLYKKASKSTLTMKLANGGWLYEEHIKEFNKMWEDGIEFKQEAA